MEYIVYVAIILGVLMLCCCGLYGVRKVEPDRHAARKSDDTSKQKINQARLRELNKVPTPWGWPGSVREHHSLSHNGSAANGSPGLHRWVDSLVSEKQTTQDSEYQRKREASLRALLEDRFHSPARMVAIDYQKTKAPLLRDPSAPHDQMDNFPSGRLNKIETRIEKVNGQPSVRPVKVSRSVRSEPLSDVRKPWGW